MPGRERRLNKGPRPDELPPSSSGALRRTRTQEGRVEPVTETISERVCAAGSRSTLIVPRKTGNRARRDPAEERRGPRVENRRPDTWGALDPTSLSTNRQRIANLARTKRGVALCSLHHVIDLAWMAEAYRLTRKDGAPGIDGVTAIDYEVNLEANLLDLLDRIKSGCYQAPPVRRAYIPKADGSHISPCLSNVFLHHVLDEWFETEVKPRLRGECTLVRFADDALMAFDNIDDAKRVLSVLGKRLARYGLTLHPDKTRLVDFRPHRPRTRGHPETDGTSFDILGLTHVWGRSRRCVPGASGCRGVIVEARSHGPASTNF